MPKMIGKQNFTKGELRHAIAEIRKKAKEKVKTWTLDSEERAELCFWVKDEKSVFFSGSLANDTLAYRHIYDVLSEIGKTVDYMKVHIEAGWVHAPDEIDHGFIIEKGNLSIY